MNKYPTIVADPPWPYDDSSGSAMRSPIYRLDGSIAKGVGVEDNYPTMSIAEIKSLPIREMAEKDAHLYLWTTNAFMVEAHEVAESWGFKPKTIVTWVKTKKDGSPSMKTGYYFRGATEHCLFCVRGSLRLQVRERGFPTVFFSERLPHSVKPEGFFAMIEEVSLAPRLELFARRPRGGWDVWGNEVGSTVEIEPEDRIVIPEGAIADSAAAFRVFPELAKNPWT